MEGKKEVRVIQEYKLFFHCCSTVPFNVCLTCEAVQLSFSKSCVKMAHGFRTCVGLVDADGPVILFGVCVGDGEKDLLS